MKFIIAFVFLTQQFVFSQEKNIDYLPLNRENFQVRPNSVTFKFSVLATKYKNRYDLARDTILKEGNYIIKYDDLFTKFSVNKAGKIDGKLDEKYLKRGKIFTTKYLVRDGFIYKATTYDSTDNLITDSDVYYCGDIIEIVMITANGEKKITIETPDTTEIRKYDKNGDFLDEEIWNKAGIGGPGK
ncbi:hypothetical protein [Flavobacterium hibernum]|uniref:Uncharacterized protein n=1 Tax=Flavobacterium hibernum TaxID=37752 RepID=A0A0D0EJ59_9FLAO|nr:hypothetical protein [Flavobacterium hibernum]KIO50770.1 hypothetical protein IW18_20825 [Flavobacterium hibernum]OXA90187.1 hypothetical protein B0A73_03945 [Flavobacterium hibernum]STO18685.1 Uncharacterised protein [Flavobacterium hibernum]